MKIVWSAPRARVIYWWNIGPVVNDPVYKEHIKPERSSALKHMLVCHDESCHKRHNHGG